MPFDREKLKQFARTMVEKGHPVEEVKEYMRRKMTMQSRGQVSPTGTQSTGAGGDAMGLIKKYFPQSEWNRAYKVMMGESGGRADAVGDTQPIRGVLAPSVGLFQIRTLPGRPSAGQLKDADFNVKYAADMWKNQGWRPWTVARNLGYK